MKLLKMIGIIIVILVLVLSVSLYFLVKNFDVNAYKDQIAQHIGSTLQTTAEIDRIDFKFSFRSGLSLDVAGLRLADQGLVEGMRVHVKSLELAVNTARFLRGGEIDVSHVTVREPDLRLDVARLQQRGRDTGAAPLAEGSRDDARDMLSRIVVQSITIDSGRVVVAADGKTLADDVDLSDVNVEVQGLSFGSSSRVSPGGVMQDPFTFQLSFKVLGSPESVSARGKGWLDMAGPQVRLDDVVIESDVSGIPVSRIAAVFPAFGALEVRRITGRLNVAVSQVVVGPDGIPVCVLSGTITQGGIFWDRVPPGDISDGTIRFAYANGDFDIADSSVAVGKGRVAFSGRVEDVLKTQRYRLEADLEGVSLGEILPRFHPEITVAGDLSGTAVMTGEGLQFPDLIETVRLESGFSVGEGMIANFNALNYIFDRITVIPDLARVLERALPEEHRREARLNQTVFDDIAVKVSAENGVLSYAADLTADIARLNAQGTLDWRNQLAFKGACVLPPNISASFIREVRVFSSLLDKPDGRIVIPLAEYRGHVNDFRPLPDMAYLAKTLIVSRVEGEVRNFLGGLLDPRQADSEADSSEAPPVEDGPSPEGSGSRDSGRRLLNSILNAVFE